MKTLFYVLAATSMVIVILQFFFTVLKSTGYRHNDEYSTHITRARDSNNVTSTSESRHDERGKNSLLIEDSNGTDITDVSHEDIFGMRKRGKKYLLVYNNVAKCGSRSMAHSIQDVLKKHGDFRGIKVKGDKRNGRDLTRSFRGVKTPAYISGHMPFVVPQRSDVVYVNMVRDPVDRFVSFYYFALNGDVSGVKPGDNNHKQNKTLDEYIEGGGSVTSNIFFHFDDAVSNISHTGSTSILQRAKANIDRYFIVVGLTEELEATVTLLGKLLPELLHGIDRVYKNTVSVRRQGYSTMNKVLPSNETVSILKEKLSAEYELYFFVKKRFNELKRKYAIT